MTRLRLLAPLALLVSPLLLAQDQSPASRSVPLKPISDREVRAVDPRPLRFGETELDWHAHSPEARAELIQILSGRSRSVRLRRWNGEGDRSAEASELSFVDQDLLIDDPTAAVWRFEFHNDGRRLTRRARWQLSRLPFVDTIEKWRTPAGVIASGEIMPLAHANNPSHFNVDLGPFLFGGAAETQAQPSAAALTSMLHGSYPAGTLYLRAVGLGRNGGPVGLPAAGVRIDLAPLTKSDRRPDTTTLPALIEVVDFSALRPVAADLGCWVRPTRVLQLELPDRPNRQLVPQDQINLCDPANSDVLFSFQIAHRSSANLVEAMQSWGEQRHEISKELVRTEVQQRFGGATAACAGECRQALGLVLDQAIATLGGPPSTMAHDPALQRAESYIERMLIHAFRLHSGMGELFEESAAKTAATLYTVTMRGTSTAQPPGFEPLESKLYRAPMITLRLAAESDATAHGWLQVRELGRTARLRPRLIPVPPLVAGQQIEIPIQLSSTQTPDVETLMLPTSLELTAGLKGGGELIERVSNHLAGLNRAIDQAYRPARRGSYKIELAWRDLEGGLEVIGVATCDAGRDRCRFKG